MNSITPNDIMPMSFKHGANVISKEVDYALRAILCLAENSRSKERISAAEISQKMDIPYRFLRNIIRPLVEAGIVDSKRGNSGGLSLAVSPASLSLFDIVKIINPRSCVLNTCLMEKGQCNRDKFCSIHCQLSKLQDSLNSKLKEIKFDTLLDG